MSSDTKQSAQALRDDFVVKPAEPSSIETLPKIKRIASDSLGPRLQDAVAIITGANSPLGIGRATAHQFAHHGARAIYICDASSSYLSLHAQELQTLYPSTAIHPRCFDAADETSVKAVVDDAISTYGRLDILFANAGVSGSNKRLDDISPDDFMHTLRTNVLSVFVAIKHAAAAMQHTSPLSKPHPSGSIIATSSVAGLRSNAGSSDYSASKAAVRSLVQTTAYQLAGTGVRVNAIMPGLVETGMTKPIFEGARKRGTEGKVGQLNPLGRGAVADEVARVALFLASGETSYVNGQGWAVDGGLSAGLPFVRGKLA